MLLRGKLSVSDNLIAFKTPARPWAGQVVPTVHVWLQVTFGRMTSVMLVHPARPCSVSCRGWRQKAAGVTFTGGTGRVLCAVIAVPASDRPLLALTSVLGAEIYRILCWQESLSLLLSQVIVGNPNFQWNTIVPQCRMRGNVRLLPAAYAV